MDEAKGTNKNPQYLNVNWSGLIGRRKLVRFTALQDGANMSLLMYSAKDLSERYNMPDTLKAQHTSHLTKGNALMSDNGRVLASIVEDSLDWHDTICGYTTRSMTDSKYGATDYQRMRNDWLRSGDENFTVELVRNGLGRRDLAPAINLFSKVFCDGEGKMHFVAGHGTKNCTVSLRTEMEVLFILSNTPHPLDPQTTYPLVPVQVEVLPAWPVDEQTDFCVNYRPENRHAYENTWEYHTLLAN